MRRGPGIVVFLSPSDARECPLSRVRRAPAASPWRAGTGLAAQGERHWSRPDVTPHCLLADTCLEGGGGDL